MSLLPGDASFAGVPWLAAPSSIVNGRDARLQLDSRGRAN